jgi:hypothetical protein
MGLVRTGFSKEIVAYIIRVKPISELGTAFNVKLSSEKLILTRATRRHIADDDILHRNHQFRSIWIWVRGSEEDERI